MTPQSAPHPTLQDWIGLVILTVLWGSAYAFIKHAVVTIPPGMLILSRIGLGAVLLTGWAMMRGRRLPHWRDPRWLWFAALGFFGNTLPFYLITWGQQYIDSALTGILVATMPLATVALAHFFVPGEHMTARKLIGFLIGFLGVIILLGTDIQIGADGLSVELQSVALAGPGSVAFLAQLAIVGAAFCYGINAVTARLLPDTPPSVSGAGVLIMATLLSLPPALLEIGEIGPVPANAWLVALWLAIGPTAIATVLLMQVSRSAGPGFLAVVNYMTPLAAVVTGFIIGEQLGWNSGVALSVILAGVWLARRRPAQRL